MANSNPFSKSLSHQKIDQYVGNRKGLWYIIIPILCVESTENHSLYNPLKYIILMIKMYSIFLIISI